MNPWSWKLCGLAFATYAGITSAQAETCDPYAKELDQVRESRISGNSQAAMAQISKILDKSPNDFRANYSKGLVIIDESGLGRSKKPNLKLAYSGIGVLLKTAGSLDQQGQECARAGGWYDIYNTIGAEFYNLGDKAKAEQYFKMALDKNDLLNAKTKAKLNSNLGQLYYSNGDYSRSLRSYEQAQRAGDMSASSKISQLSAFAAKK